MMQSESQFHNFLKHETEDKFWFKLSNFLCNQSDLFKMNQFILNES